MQKTIDFFKKYYHILLFSISSLAFGICSFCITLFGDDCGYYLYASGTLKKFISSMAYHTTHSNGRTFVHFLDALLLQGDMIPWKIFNTFLCAYMIFIIAMLSVKAYKSESIKEIFNQSVFKTSLTLSSLLFLVITPSIISGAILWATGAMNYFFPASLFLSCLFFGLRYETTNRSPVLFALFAVLCAFSAEQASFSSVLFVALIFIVNLKKTKRIDAFRLCVLVLTIIASAILFFSPANSERMTLYPEFYSKNIFERVLGNLNEWSLVCFSSDTLLFAYSIAIAVFTYEKIRKNGFDRIIGIVCAALLLLQNTIVLCSLPNLTNAFICLLPLFVCVLIMIVTLFFDSKKKNDYFDFSLFTLAFFLQLSMLISPQYGARTTLISLLLLYIFIIKNLIFNDEIILGVIALFVFLFLPLEKSKTAIILLWVIVLSIAISLFVKLALKNNGKTAVKAFCASMLAMLCLSQGFLLIRGYIQNAQIYLENNARIEEYLQGDMTLPLTLKYPKNNQYRYHYPCDGDLYHMVSFNQAHGLEDYTVINWEE